MDISILMNHLNKYFDKQSEHLHVVEQSKPINLGEQSEHVNVDEQSEQFHLDEQSEKFNLNEHFNLNGQSANSDIDYQSEHFNQDAQSEHFNHNVTIWTFQSRLRSQCGNLNTSTLTNSYQGSICKSRVSILYILLIYPVYVLLLHPCNTVNNLLQWALD